jgi:phage terminase small subunit
VSLNPKRQRFVEEYLVDLNATQAAIRAGYSPRTANEQGAQLLAILSVREAVDQALAERSRKAGFSEERVMRELARVGFGDPRSVLRWGPGGVKLRDSAELTDDEAAMIAEVAETKDGMRIKMHSKLDALKLIGQRLSMWTDNQNLNLAGGVTVRIEGDDAAL